MCLLGFVHLSAQQLRRRRRRRRFERYHLTQCVYKRMTVRFFFFLQNMEISHVNLSHYCNGIGRNGARCDDMLMTAGCVCMRGANKL